jgi:hypothetical protein
MGTFAEEIAVLRRQLQDPNADTWTAADLKQFYNEANASLCHELYEVQPQQLKRDTITAVAGTQEYDLPADFGLMKRVWITDAHELYFYKEANAGIYSLDVGSPAWYYIFNALRVNGATPTTYYYQIGFVPIPGAADTINIEYYPVPTVLSDDDDVSPIPAAFHDLIRLEAGLKAFLMRGEVERDRQWRRQRDERFQQFMYFLSSLKRPRTGKFVNVFADPEDYDLLGKR